MGSPNPNHPRRTKVISETLIGTGTTCVIRQPETANSLQAPGTRSVCSPCSVN